MHHFIRLQNSRFFFSQINKEIGVVYKESYGRVRQEKKKALLASLPSLALCFQPFSACLTARGIRKNTDRFEAVYRFINLHNN